MKNVNSKAKLVLWAVAIAASWGACYVSGYKFGETLGEIIYNK